MNVSKIFDPGFPESAKLRNNKAVWESNILECSKIDFEGFGFEFVF